MDSNSLARFPCSSVHGEREGERGREEERETETNKQTKRDREIEREKERQKDMKEREGDKEDGKKRSGYTQQRTEGTVPDTTALIVSAGLDSGGEKDRDITASSTFYTPSPSPPLSLCCPMLFSPLCMYP